MTPSEVALARFLREWQKWKTADHIDMGVPWCTMDRIERMLSIHGLTSGDALTPSAMDFMRRAEEAGVFTEAEHIAGAIHVIAGNNNQPRVVLQGAGVELVRSHRALADMTLPVNVKDAQDIREAAIRALCSALVRPAVAPSMMTRDLQKQTFPTPLDPTPELLDEVEAHRETKQQLAEAEQRIEELEAELVGLTAQGKP